MKTPKNMTKITFSIALLLMLFSTFSSHAQLPAFPGAEGFGKYTVGGRGGQVIYVTNLNDGGAGSLREAINTSGPRTVLFKVGGLITVNSPLIISDPNISILGQSAPGDGIAITSSIDSGAGIQISASEVIIRYIRVRRGTTLTYNGSADAFYIESGVNIILDHCSMAFANDENLGIARYGANPTQNITIQYSIISNPYGGSSKGSLCVRDINYVTFFRNAFMSNVTRNPYMSPQTDNPDYDTYFELVNNVIYNGKYYIEVTRDDSYLPANEQGLSTGVPHYNVVNNYAFLPTDNWLKRAERQMILSYGDFPLKIFAKGNIHPLRTAITNDVPYTSYTTADWAEEWATTQGQDGFASLNIEADANRQLFAPASTPIMDDNVALYVGPENWNSIKDHVGASYPTRDSHDVKMVNEAETLTRTDSYVNNALPVYNNISNNSPYTDVNDDGIEDTWFTTNVISGDIANDISPIGYTWVENYLNEISNGQIPDIPAENVLVTPNTATINVPNTVPLFTAFTPVNTSNQSGAWASNDINIATVASNGLVTAVSEGIVTITFTSNSGDFTDSAEITVTNIVIPLESVSVNPTVATIEISENSQLIATLVPTNTTDASGTWISSNDLVAIVDENGLVTGVGEGQAIITYTSNSSGLTASSSITVIDTFFGTYVLYNAATDLLIQNIIGDTDVNLADEGNEINFRSIPQGGDDNTEVESVRVDWIGPSSGTWSESGPIYAGLPNGHVGLNFESYIVEEGTYNFTVTYYSADGAVGDIVAIDNFSLSFLFDTALVANAGIDQSICEGETITLIATGGTSFLWNTGETTASIDVVPAQTTIYTVTVSNIDGEEDTDNVTVTVNVISTADAGEDQTICEGESATLTASGGTSYLWSNGETTASIDVSPSAETIYSVEVTSNTCSITDSVTVFIDIAPNITVSSDIVIVDGESSTLAVNGSDNYQWNTGETTAFINVTPMVTTTYTVTSQSLNGCSSSADVTVIVIPEVIADAGADTTICRDESVTLNATGGGSYLWNTGDITSELIVNPLITTTYTVTVEDDFGYNDTDSVTITVTENPDITVSEDSVIIDGESATLVASGGDNYQWSSGEITATISVTPNTTTTYTVISTAVGGCADIEQVTVTVVPEVIANAGLDATICSGETVILSASGGSAYLWNTGETASDLTISPLVSATYTVTVEDDFGFTDTDSVTITVNATPDIFVSNDLVIMDGESTTLIANGGDNYQWNTGETSASIIVSPTITTTYTVSSFGTGNCEDTEEIIVTVIPELLANAGSDTAICSVESITLIASGGVSYTWNTGDTGPQIIVSPTVTTTYSVTVEDSFGNSDTDSVTVTVNEMPNISVSNDVTIMNGASTTLIANGGENYQWNTGETTATILVSPTNTTTYTVNSFGTGDCEDTEEVTVTVIPELVANAGSDESICSGESITLNASGGVSYIWNTSDTGPQIIVSPTVTTTYSVTVEDSFGNSDTDSVTITVNETPNISVSNDVTIMNGASTTLIANGGENYQWNTGETTATILVSPTNTATYTVNSLGTGDCEDTEEVTVTVIPELVANAGSDESICSGESITLNASGGVSYIWNTSDTVSQLVVSPTVTTTYSVTVEDSFGNSDSDSVTITVNETPNISVSNDVTIMNGASTPLIANGGDNYQWNTGETTATILVSPTNTTTYTVNSLGTGDCEDAEEVTVTVIPELIANAGVDSAICNGDSITLNASGGISYTWNTGDTGSQLIVSPNVTTTYTVTVEDGLGNSDNDSVTIVVNEIPNVTVSPNISIVVGETASLVASGAQTYQWSTGQTTSSIDVSPTQTTTYIVIATTNTCSIQAQVTVTVEGVFEASAGADQRVCQNDTYEVVLTANQGDSYLWNTGETSQSITVSPLATSTYTVTVTQGVQGDTDNVTVYVDPNPDVVILNGDSIDIMDGDFVTLSATGANSYEWNNGATQPNIAVSPSVTTTYEVRGYVGDCYDEKQITVNVIPDVIADAGENVLICLEEVATLTASGGEEYVWSTGETTQTIQVSPGVTTEYTVTVFNAVDFDEDTVIVEIDVNCGEDSVEDPIDVDPQDFTFDIFPNPASNVVNIKLSGSNILTNIYMYDIIGKLIHSTRISNEDLSNSSTTQIDISMLQTGIYYIKLVDIHRDISKKLIVN